MSTRKIVNRFLTMFLMLMFAGCGASSESGGNGTVQMGGAVQGKSLTLSGTITTLAGSTSNRGSVDGTGAAASFYDIGGITTDGTTLYVADAINNTIRKTVISTGTVSTLAGTAGTTGATDGIGAAARFNGPTGITTDGVNLYVTDQLNYTIRKVVIATGEVTTLAGSAGTYGSADGTGAARFYGSAGITTDGLSLYVADSDNDTIRKIVISSGVVTTLAGTAGTYGSVDGIGAAARFGNPFGITTDGTNLYVLDHGNGTIRKIVISTGAVSTLAGSAGAPRGSLDGTGAAARFYTPSGITTDGVNLYVPDFSDTVSVYMAIRKIDISTGEVTSINIISGSLDGIPESAGVAPMGLTTDGKNLYTSNYIGTVICKIQ